jgi:probable F420-dependent oxidoreductase
VRIDLQLDAPPDRAADRARELADTGADGLFTFEGPHDVFLPLALATQATGLPIMTNVAIALPRSPLHLAHAAHDLHLLSGGQFTLGLGSQVRTHIERRYGAPWSRPAARMAEIVGATREILAAWDQRRAPSYAGEFTRHDYMPPLFRPEPLPWGPPPVMMGALGPVMTRRAGEVADGLLLMPFNSRQHILERALPALRAGVEASGRSVDEVAVVPQVIAAVGRTEQELAQALPGARGLVAFYASTPAYRPVLEVHGRADLQPRLQELMREGDTAAMTAAIDDELFDTIAVRGTPAECARLIAAKFEGVGDRACVYFPGSRHSPEVLGELVDAMHAS